MSQLIAGNGERLHAPPPHSNAARHLDIANTAIKEAVALLRARQGSEILTHVANWLGHVADHFRRDQIATGLAHPLINRRMAAKEMGKATSPAKLAGLETARAKLKSERDKARQRRLIEERTVQYRRGKKR